MVADVRVLADRYELDAVIGNGGMADVFRAVDRTLQRTVAIKMLRTATVDSAARERFTTEAHTLASLSHPGLVTLLDADILDQHPFLVMELVEGPSLAEEIRARGPLSPARVAEIGGQVAEALGYAHHSGVVHRDVKPGNILLADDDRALLTDFGIARFLADDVHRTREGETIGSPAYLSPEQVNGEPLTEAVDVYSLGLVLLEALTGRRAYPGTPVESAVARLCAAPAIPTSLNVGWRNLLGQMTDRWPANRPSTLEVAATLNSSFARTTVAEPLRDLDAGTAAFELPVADGPQARPATDQTLIGSPLPRRRSLHRRHFWPVAAMVLAVLVAVAIILPIRTGTPTAVPRYEAPAGVPLQMRQPLQDLHRAVDDAGLATLAARADQIDESLVTQYFAQARRDLGALAAETRTALAAGDLGALEAQHVLAAITALRGTLPEPPTSTPTAIPTTRAKTSTTDARPVAPSSTGHGKGHGHHKKPK